MTHVKVKGDRTTSAHDVCIFFIHRFVYAVEIFITSYLSSTLYRNRTNLDLLLGHATGQRLHLILEQLLSALPDLC